MRSEELNETWHVTPRPARRGCDVLGDPARDEPDDGGEWKLQCDAEPEHRAGKEEGHVARVDHALEMLLRDKGADAERGQRQRRVPLRSLRRVVPIGEAAAVPIGASERGKWG